MILGVFQAISYSSVRFLSEKCRRELIVSSALAEPTKIIAIEPADRVTFA